MVNPALQESPYKRIVSLARKRIRNKQKHFAFLQENLVKYKITAQENISSLDDIFEHKFKSYALEIGFGDGNNIVNAAKNDQETGYIGCEVFTAGIIDTIKKAQENSLSNIKIWHQDALDFLKLIPNNSLKLIYILHPDPWPKTRHHKRRLINTEFLKTIKTKMAPGAQLLIITDHADYAQHISTCIDGLKDLFTISENHPPIVKTKYRLKADALGVKSHYFCLNS